MKTILLPLLLVLGILGNRSEGLWCDRMPQNVAAPKTKGDNGYKIEINGDPDKYIAGATYTVRIQAPGNQYSVEKFTGFLLVAEPSDGISPESSAGSFQLTSSDSLSRFSEYCPHAVKHASEIPKTSIQVQWIAPSVASTCISFRATLIKNKVQWYMDDNQLTKELCPEVETGEGEENEEAEQCCACNEAKYEGSWSPLTHPKDFPADAWAAHFSDIVGASHSLNFRFWQPGAPSSEGLVQLAETGDSKDLERELKDESQSIRTIIKARGLRHPNFFGHKTFAVFRADKDHNLISLVSKIAPSPDWFVGVSGLNLCLRNCSWVEGKEIPLYPWDAGSDSGVSYLSEKSASIPRERISRIVWTPRQESPFYDPSGNMVKPFAKLRIQKQRSYGACEDQYRVPGELEEEEDSFEDSPECGTTPWVDGSPCSATCGMGVMQRKRSYLNPMRSKDMGCGKKLSQTVPCNSYVPCGGGGGGIYQPRATNNYPAPVYPTSSSSSSSYGDPLNPYSKPWSGGAGPGYEIPRTNNPCAVSAWKPWSSCSKACGQGIRKRLREFINPSLASSYSCNQNILAEVGPCNTPCSGSGKSKPGCELSEWGPWQPCSVSLCGSGTKQRNRVFADSDKARSLGCKESLIDTVPCTGTYPDCAQMEARRVICSQPKDPGGCTGSYGRWYFDAGTKTCRRFEYSGCPGNNNIFPGLEDCEKTCGFLKEEKNKNNQYNEPLLRNESSYRSDLDPYSFSFFGQEGKFARASSSQSPFNNDGPMEAAPVDCEVSEWSKWSKCTVDCGRGHKYRSRYVTRFPQNDGEACPRLEHRRKCRGTSCPRNHPLYNYTLLMDANEGFMN